MADTVKAINTTGQALCLASGIVPPGDTGEATPAEMSTLSAYLQPVEPTKEEKPSERKSKKAD